jgi:hypothetical protein
VDVRVESALRLDLREAFLLERLAERLLDELDPVDESGLLMLLRGFERPLQVVEDGEQLADEPLVRMGDEPLLFASGPLPVVLEVGLHALEKVEVLVPLRGDSREPVVGSRSCRLRLLDLRMSELLAHDFVAPSSSSMTSKSASSTTSSSAVEPPLPEACAPA